MKYRDHAVVLKRRRFGETDWAVTFLTRNYSIRTALVKYAQRPNHKLRVRLRIGAVVDAEFLSDKPVVTHAVPIFMPPDSPYVPAMMDAAQAFVEDGPAHDIYRLTIGALRSKDRPDLVFAAYLIQALEMSGWGVSIRSCAICSAPGPHRAFSPTAGGSVCPHCRPAGSTVLPGIEPLRLMLALGSGDLEAAQAIQTDSYLVVRLMVEHVQTHLECRLTPPTAAP